MSYSVELPVYINTAFGYFCEGCNMSELTIKTVCLSSSFDVGGEVMVHTLSCENYLCKANCTEEEWQEFKHGNDV